MNNKFEGSENSMPTFDNAIVNDSPAESFEKLYGPKNVSNNNVETINQSNMNVNPVPNMSESTPNPFGMNQAPQNNISVNPVPNMSESTPNPFGMNQAPQNNVSVNPVPNMSESTPNPFGMNQAPQNNVSVNSVPNMSESTPNPFGMDAAPQNNVSVNPVPNMSESVPNPLQMNQTFQNDMSINQNNSIDEQRMQSIEEQLSKTSQYNPEDLQQEKINIPTDNQYEKNKSGLSFVIVLFIILALVIAFLPQITKLIK